MAGRASKAQGRTDDSDAARGQTGTSEADDLHPARLPARERYLAIAEALKAEAGITRHHKHKIIGGLAWSGTGRILAPEGFTRRQLYVLAHECGHNVLHGTPAGMAKAAHVKEHEAETYAHRAFARYGLDVPETSARWARAYVGLWIMKDRAAGVPICPMAAEWAAGKRSPHDPLPSVDGQPPNDFSKSIERFTAKGVKRVEAEEAMLRQSTAVVVQDMLPNTCATCWFYTSLGYSDWHLNRCVAFSLNTHAARTDARHCNNGISWRPNPALLKKYNYDQRSFWAKLGTALLDRISGRYRLREIEQSKLIEPPQRSTVVKIEDGAKSKKS